MQTTTAIRNAAIDHHHELSEWFDQTYQKLHQDRFSNEFTYGRSKIDAALRALMASLEPSAVFLDVGCGTGEQLKLAQTYNLRVNGVEPAPGMLEIARRNVPGVEIVQGVATHLPFADDSMDAMIEIEVLRYLDRTDFRRALQEAKRVLKPSGTLLITLVNRWALDGFYVRQRWRQLLKGKSFSTTNPHCEFFSPGEAMREMRQAGFVDVRVDGRMLAPLRPLWRIAPGVSARIARWLEHADDRLHGNRLMARFAGHLIVTGKAPGTSQS